MSNEVMLALIAVIQALGAAWINRQVKTYACGGARCVDAISKAIQKRSKDMSGRLER